MNRFLVKHNIDIGKTFGILLLCIMVLEIYDLIADWLFFFPEAVNINFGIPILLLLGIGMFKHNRTARKVILFLLWAGVTLSVIFLILYPIFPGKIFVKVNSIKVSNAPYWKFILIEGLLLPSFLLLILSLKSRKARQEFGIDEAAAEAAPLPTSGEQKN